MKNLKLPPKRLFPGEKPLTEEERKKRKERSAKIKAIAREFEAKKRSVGLKAPVLKKGFFFYAVVLMGLLIVGGVVIQSATKAGAKRQVDVKRMHAGQSLDVLAEALGRFKFHTGKYPDAVDGLTCLSRNDNGLKKKYPGWLGRYTQRDIPDPWKRPFVYEPGTNGEVVLLSLGADGIRGTADDVLPHPESFLKPFQDTTWTNNWAPYESRGIVVVDKHHIIVNRE